MIRKIAFGGLCILALASFSPQKRKKEKSVQTTTAGTDYKAVGAPLPALRVATPKGTVITEKDLDTSGNLFLMMFNPTCGHCEDVTRMLEKNLSLFREGQILLVAGAAMMPYLEYFNATTKVYEYPKIQVGVDSSGIIEKTFIYNSLPQINIYDKNRRLLKTLNSDVPLDSLRPYIR